MRPNYNESIKFLQKWLANGPWILTAISLDKKNIETRTFTETDKILEWLEIHGSNRNIYFSVNPTIHPVNKKPMREDIKSMDWLHVDVDPRAGEDIEAEQKRALALLQTPPNNIPSPTVIVFSGGGYQGFWKLIEPFDINGQETAFEDAKRYNQALELALGADNCHNVDRIMRLPGTINRPDARKQKKGRQPALAKLIEWHDDRIYPITKFTQAPEVQTEQVGFGTKTTIQISGNIKRLDDVNELPDRVSDLCKVVIVQGTDPDNTSRFPSRSEALFFVCCELHRANVSEEMIFSIITDKDFGISSSVLEKGTGYEKYALRQIERAKDEAIHPKLRELNEKYAVVTMGGKQRIIYEDHDELLDRHRLIKMTFEDFRNKYMHQRIQQGTDAQGNPRYIPLGKWWLENRERRQYEKIVFAPGKSTPNSYNMWRGFPYEPREGTQHQYLFDHIFKNVCGQNEELFNYVVSWLARAVQFPAEPGYTALVLRGDQGVGKGFLARTAGKLFGRHFIHVSNAQHLTGNFNAHLRDCVVLFADEAFYAGDKRHASTLKTLVTEDSIMIEPKGIDTEMVANCLHIIMASNEDWVVPAGMNERRFCVLDVSDAHMQDAIYFGKIADAMKNSGYNNLLNFLLQHDIKKFDVRRLPKTKALQDQKIFSYEPVYDWWYNKLSDGKLFIEDGEWKDHVLVERLIDDFTEYLKQFNVMSRKGSATKLGRFLKIACPEGKLIKKQGRDAITYRDMEIKRPYFYFIPSLEILRKHWDEKFGGPYDWPTIEEIDNGDKKEDIPF
jgi:hypothetical protein